MFCASISLIVTAAIFHRPDGINSNVLSFIVPGNKLRPVVGQASPDGAIIKLSGLRNGVAVISSGPIQLLASDFPYITLNQSGLDSRRLVAELFWRKKGQENLVNTERFNHYHSGSLTLKLAKNAQWNGEIVEFGLSFQGVLNQPVIINSVDFEVWSTSAWARSIWDQWWAYGGWKGTSVNFTSGGQYDKVQNIPAPELTMVPVIASWLGLSIFLYFLYSRVVKTDFDVAILLCMFLLAWLLLDSRWLHELWQRTLLTENAYGGKTQQQKWQNENDRAWYLMAQEIKQKLPEKSARVFQILKKTQPLDDYHRYRVRYHLLPHNIFPYSQTLPNKSQIKNGDYILDLGEFSGLDYASDSQQLSSVRFNALSLQPIVLKYQSKLGRLYQYQGR